MQIAACAVYYNRNTQYSTPVSRTHAHLAMHTLPAVHNPVHVHGPQLRASCRAWGRALSKSDTHMDFVGTGVGCRSPRHRQRPRQWHDALLAAASKETGKGRVRDTRRQSKGDRRWRAAPGGEAGVGSHFRLHPHARGGGDCDKLFRGRAPNVYWGCARLRNHVGQRSQVRCVRTWADMLFVSSLSLLSLTHAHAYRQHARA